MSKIINNSRNYQVMLLFSCLILLFQVVFSEVFQKYQIVKASERRSLCNDGTPSIYYVNKTISRPTQNWVIHIDGGGGCSTIEQCEQRKKYTPFLMTSEGFNDTLVRDSGMFSADCNANPATCNYNKVFIHYCSSDWWSGDNDKSATTGNLYFNGKNIISSAFQDLLDFHDLNLAERVIISGDSAGGVGIWNRGDEIGDFLLNKVKTLKDFRMISGCGFFLNGTGYTGKSTTYEDLARLGSSKDFWNFQPQKECGEKFGEDLAYLCMVGYLVFPFVRHEKMGIFLEYDLVQSSLDGILASKIEDLTSEERKWINGRGNFVQNAIKQIDMKNVWSVGCWRHDILPGTPFLNWKSLDNVTPAIAVAEWIEKGESRHVDECVDVSCNSNCN